jgi:hypothetical protein
MPGWTGVADLPGVDSRETVPGKDTVLCGSVPYVLSEKMQPSELHLLAVYVCAIMALGGLPA